MRKPFVFHHLPTAFLCIKKGLKRACIHSQKNEMLPIIQIFQPKIVSLCNIHNEFKILMYQTIVIVIFVENLENVL